MVFSISCVFLLIKVNFFLHQTIFYVQLTFIILMTNIFLKLSCQPVCEKNIFFILNLSNNSQFYFFPIYCDLTLDKANIDLIVF